jgi:type III secretion system FlhB-like substrate exporter
MPEGEESSNVSPEEQAQYTQFVENAMAMMYDDKMMPTLIQQLKTGDKPAEALGNAVATIVMRLEDSAKDKGIDLSGDVMFHGATEILEQLVELAEAAGVEVSEEDMESALYIGLDTYRSTRQQQGRLPTDEISQDMQELLQAEQEGTIDQMLPGISEYAQRAPKGEQPQGPGGLIRQ